MSREDLLERSAPSRHRVNVDFSVGDPHGGERVIRAPAYACREPGFMHGPVRTEGGCLLLEFSSYPAAAANA